MSCKLGQVDLYLNKDRKTEGRKVSKEYTEREIQELLGDTSRFYTNLQEKEKYEAEQLKKRNAALKVAALLSKEGIKIPAAHSVLELAESYFEKAADTSKLFSNIGEILN